MLTRTRKIVASCLLVLTGVMLLAYGLFFHLTKIAPAQESDRAILAKPESTLIKEVTVGGLERDESGQVKKAYTGKPPQACPT